MNAAENLRVSTTAMADALGISTRRLQQLVAGGWIDGRMRRDSWDLGATIRSYLTHQKLSAARGKDPSYEE